MPIPLPYAALLASTGSPVIAANRAVALAETAGAAAGLAAGLATDPAVRKLVPGLGGG